MPPARKSCKMYLSLSGKDSLIVSMEFKPPRNDKYAVNRQPRKENSERFWRNSISSGKIELRESARWLDMNNERGRIYT